MRIYSARARAFQLLDTDSHPFSHGMITGLLLVAIAVALAAAMLETLPDLNQAAGTFVWCARGAAMSVFSLELLIRIWVAPEDVTRPFQESEDLGGASAEGVLDARFAYLRSPLGLVDLAVVLPAWVALVYPVPPQWFEIAAALALFKLARYTPGLSLVWAVVVHQARSLFAGLTVLTILLFIAATAVYLVEHQAQPTDFESIPKSLWWAIVTIATVGYGDITPITPLGRLIGGVTMLLGIAMFAVPAGILASGFAEEVKRRDFVVTWQSVARVPLFAQLDAAVIAAVAQLLKPRSVSANQVIVRRGDPGDSMFFIMEGEVEVDLAPNPALLKSGKFFGEIALVRDVNRTATVIARSNCRLLMLETTDFRQLIHQYPELNVQIQRVAAERVPAN